MQRDLDWELQEVQRLVRVLYGDSLSGLSGVLHCVSCVRVPSDPAHLHVIAINQHAPRSPSDFFVLNLARAHADAIVTTAQVVRAEPQLSHQLQGPLAKGLARYRREVLGRSERQCVAILTRSAQLPVDHHMFQDPLDNFVLIPPEHAAALALQLAAAEANAEVVPVASLDIRTASDLLFQRGARTVLIEAGPSTASALYDPPARVQHLWLSRYEAPLDPRALGGALPVDAALFAGLECASEHMLTEPSGPWRFQHWLRSD
jgi:riboflavin biosynthesis pyrimidine reductase